MARHFFILLFLSVVLCSTLCVSGYANGVGEAQNPGELSAEILVSGNKLNDVKEPDNSDSPSSTRKTITLCKINLPFLLFSAKDDVMVAVAKAEYVEEQKSCDASNGDKKVDVVAKYFETKNIDIWNTAKIKEAITKGKTQFVTEKNDKASVFFTVKAPILTADESKIHIFLISVSGQSSSQNKEFKLVEGTISGGDGSKVINWKTEPIVDLKSSENFETKLKNYKIESFFVDGFAFLTKNKKIVLVLKGKTEDKNKNVTVFILLKETSKEIEYLHDEITENNYPTFFQWKEEIFMIPTENTEEGQNKMMEFDADSKTFVQTNNSITRLHYFLKEKNNFVNATIADKDVLLFTQPRNSNGDKKNVYLWMTDGTRVSCAGAIFLTELTKPFYLSILHTNNELFALHQTSEAPTTSGNTNKIELTLLKDQLEYITNVLTAWNKSKNEIEKLYKDTPTKTEINFADGIVGFLSGNGDGNNWEDGYLYANAVVTTNNNKGSATRENNGFKFTGAGAGAQWPVNKALEDQPYNFIDTGFTLVATVTVGNGTKGNDISVLGVSLTGTTNKVGLWCTTNGKWAVKVGNGQTNILSSDINCTRNEKYYVAVILNNKKLFVYVDGEQIPKLDNEGIDITQLQNIDYFYFGVDKDKENAKTDVTITDVLLYNWPFEKNKVKKLKPKKERKLDPEQKREGDTSDLPTPDESTIRTDSSSPDTSATPTATEKDGAEIKLCLFFMNNVTVLCFMLFGVFTLLGR